MLIGPAVDEAADLYEAMDWIGIFHHRRVGFGKIV
jgi:hypothetical protein